MLHKYLITSKEFYTDTSVDFCKILEQQLKKHQPDYVLYRDKENPKYALLAQDFMAVCAKFKDIKTFIHTDVALASKLGAYGVHLSSLQFDEIQRAKQLGLQVIISTHTQEEVIAATKEGVDYVTYSPIFATPNKGIPKGIEALQELLLRTKVKVFALGGIVSETQIQSIKKTDAYGFASIRYFY